MIRQDARNNNASIVTGFKSMTSKQFEKFRKFIYDQCGIKLSDAKKTLLEGRLQKRMRRLGMSSFQDYEQYIFSPEGMQEELIQMIDVITTNKTDFFRESNHFDYLVNEALPALIDINGSVYREIRIWSAGCSTGEEPYTMGIVLSEYANKVPGFKFSVLATDISTKVLQHAVSGIYDSSKVVPIPIALKKKYLLKHKDKTKKIVRIAPELRKQVTFKRLNFMDSSYGIEKPMHIIFCRNVLIYFDRETQERIINKFCKNLVNGGYLFLGHSETLNGLRVSLTQVSPTVYRKMR